MAGTYTLSSQRKKTGSGTQKLASFREKAAISASKKGETPAQYAAKVAAQPTPTPTTRAPATTYSFGGLLEQAMSQQSQIQQLQQRYAPKGILENVISQQQAKKQALITGSGASSNPTKRDQENIRAIIGTGYVKPGVVFGATPQAAKVQNMIKALQQDINLREPRINTRENTISRLEGNLIKTQTQVNYYNSFIKNGVFTGTNAQYNAYKKAYADYEKNYNQYSRAVKLQNTDINTYNKNVSSIESKKGFKKTIALKNKIGAVYTRAEATISKKLPTTKQAEPYIRAALKNARVAGFVTPYQLTSITDKVLKRNDTEKIIQFNLGAYESVQQKPLKAAATFITFAVGGVVLKGLSGAAKVLGAGAKTAKAAQMIETTALQVYITSSGLKIAEAKNARELGYRTGDVIFNELLPAGLGLKYGVKIVESIPKGAKLLKGGSSRFLASEKAQVGGSKDLKLAKKRAAARQVAVAKTKTATKTEDQLIAEFEASQAEFMKQELALQNEYNQVLSQISKAETQLSQIRLQASKQRTYAKSRARAREGTTYQALSEEASLRQRSIQMQREKLRTQRLKLEAKIKELQAQANIQQQAQKQNLKTIQKQEQPSISVQKTKAIQKTIARNIQAQRTIANQLQKQRQNTKQLLKQISKTDLKVSIANDNIQALKAITRQVPSYKPKTTTVTKTKIVPDKVTTAKAPRRPRTTREKIEEKPPEVIIPKLKSITTKKKKAKPSKKTKVSTSKHINVNAVSTFKDLLK